MKKIFTLACLLLLCVATEVNAQGKSWDFTKWSSTTLSNLEKDAEAGRASTTWTALEKAAETNTECDNKAYWFNNSTNGPLLANGAAIAELEGIEYADGSARWLAIVHDLGSTTLGTYAGSKYLWMGGSGKSLKIKNVKPGAIIEMDVESHKPTEGRGVNLVVNDKNLDFIEGTATPKEKTHCKWQVPTEGITTETVDVIIKNTNGCHIYCIDIDGGSGAAEVKKNVAYVGDENTVLYAIASGSDAFNWTVIPDDADVTADSLMTFDALVVSSTLPAEATIAGTLKGLVAYTPMLNLNANLYPVWGFGALKQSEETTFTFGQNVNENLLANLSVEENVWDLGANVNGVTLSGYFANDSVIATSGDAVAMHAHNIGRNTYMFLPFDEESISATEEWAELLNNSIAYVADTKRDVTAAAAPAITGVQGDGVTIVTIACSTPGAVINYTVDGTEPTTESPVYTAAFDVNVATTVKAIANADGYTQSAVATKEITVAQMAATPVISLEKKETSTVITINSQEGTNVYYSFKKGNNTVTASSTYTEPITVTEPTYIYAFVTGENLLNSEVAAAYVPVNSVTAQTIRLDTLAHFTANETDWYTNVEYSDNSLTNGGASAVYYFGKSAWNYYKTVDVALADAGTIEPGYVKIDTLKDVAGADSAFSVKYIAPDSYKYLTSTSDPKWIVKTNGATVTGETQLAQKHMVYNGAAQKDRYADSEDDLIGEITPTKGCFDINAARVSGDPYSAVIESRVKFQAPFNVLSFLGNGSTANSLLEIQVSADGENWNTVDTLNISLTQRYWKRTLSSYNGNDEVYVRLVQVANGGKPQVYDIYVLNNGQYSQQYNAQNLVDGIEEIIAQPAKVNNDKVYDLAGRRVMNASAPGLYIKGGKKVLVK